MSGRLGALILVVLSACAAADPVSDRSGAWEWKDDDADHGGYSAIEIMPGGQDAVVVSDRGRLVRVALRRDGAGRIAGLSADGGTMLAPFRGGEVPDTEGLAIQASGGPIYITDERTGRVMRYTDPAMPPRALPIPPAFGDLPKNRGLEGLAIADDGALWTTPEDVSGDMLPTYIYRSTEWTDGPALPRRGEFVPVGLDFDATGRLYLLERDLEGVLGFRSRVRRFTFDGDRVATEEELFASLPGVYDNLEGIAVWRDDAGGLHLTMISDDNFIFFQRTEIVEYDLPR